MEQLGHAVVGKVLVDGQVGSQCPHPGPVTRRGDGLGWRHGLGLAAASAPAALHAVLGDERPDRWQLEDLAALDADDVYVVEIPTTATARCWRMGLYLVGVLHLGQVLAFCAGLLPRASLGGSSFGPVGNGRLGEQLCRRRHRRVARISTQALFQIGDARCNRTIEHFQLPDALLSLLAQQLERSNDLGQLLIRGRVVERRRVVGWKSRRYARRSPRWAMVRSGVLNKYGASTLIQPNPSLREVPLLRMNEPLAIPW